MINLEKGIGIDLTKEDESLEVIKFRLTWKPQMKSGEDFDLDASALVLGSSKPVDEDFVFFRNRTHPSGAVTLDKDDRSGKDDGETILLDIKALPAEKDKVILAINIDKATQRGQNFGQVRDSKVEISNALTGKKIAEFDLGEEFSREQTVVAGEVYRYRGEIRFKGIGAGYNNGLAGLLEEYGFVVGKRG